MKGRKIILLLYIKFLGIDYLKEVGYGCKWSRFLDGFDVFLEN